MSDIDTYLSFFADPFQTAEPALAFGEGNREPREITLEELSKIRKPIVAHDFWMLVNSFRVRNLRLPSCIIDIPTAIKLCTGQPRSAFRNAYPWDYWRAIKPLFARSESVGQYDHIREIFFSKQHLSFNRAELPALLKSLVQRTIELWQKVAADLDSRGETKRFFEIELPIYNLFLERQLLGIQIDKELITSHIKTLTHEHYSSLKLLRTKYKIPERDLEWNNLKQLCTTREPFLADKEAELENFEDYLRLIAYGSDFAKTAETFRRSLQDKLTLERIGVTNERIYPVFDTVGTVTSRILVSDPLIQHIRRRYRGVLHPDPGKRLVYLDYKQFEPGILAQFSGDKELITTYNQSDLYLLLSQALFNSDLKRDLCKRLFLAFSYGMDRKNIVALLTSSEADNNNKTRVEKAVQGFFSKFSSIEPWKRAIAEELHLSGRIGTSLGNFRYRKRDGDLAAEERRWAISQVVQGSASLILKRAILGLTSLRHELQILLPMHDAVLLQIDDNKRKDNLISAAKDILKAEFRRICSSIDPIVETKRFDD